MQPGCSKNFTEEVEDSLRRQLGVALIKQLEKFDKPVAVSVEKYSHEVYELGRHIPVVGFKATITEVHDE